MILSIEAEWENLNSGTPEERACFAAIGIRYNTNWLTQAEDSFVKRLRDKVHLSAYRLAEWLAWNWWRLRWEPRTGAPDWALAHRLTTIGGGYVWPNVTVFSDGERVAMLAKPTQPRPAEPLRYVSDIAAIIRADEFEHAVDLFIQQVRGQLRAESISDTNLDQIWEDVLAERLDRSATSRRKFEALLGFDPDEADPARLEALVRDAQELGERAMDEVAAETGAKPNLVTASLLHETATTYGFDATPADVVRLATNTSLPPVGVPAWRRGAEAAQALRAQEQLGTGPIQNERLTQMAGVSSTTPTELVAGPNFSFALDENARTGRVVLRSKWETGRRFELARLIGDRMLGGVKDRLFPATHASTYRQKMQRAFAAEVLCPVQALEDILGGDYSSESIEDAAAHFKVSDYVVRTSLVNHGRLDRTDLEGDLEPAVAA